MRIEFELIGRTALLMHQDDVEQADLLDAWRKAPENKNFSRSGDDRSPPWTWQTYLYADGEHVTVPSDNLMVCLRKAAAQITLKKQKSFKEISQSGMVVEEEFLTFSNDGQRVAIADVLSVRDKPFEAQAKWALSRGFRLFVKRAAVGRTKHIRVRPRFDKWRATGSLRVTAPELTLEVVRKMLDIAGTVGLGDWRPGCKTPGMYGMFSASLKDCG